MMYDDFDLFVRPRLRRKIRQHRRDAMAVYSRIAYTRVARRLAARYAEPGSQEFQALVQAIVAVAEGDDSANELAQRVVTEHKSEFLHAWYLAREIVDDEVNEILDEEEWW